MSNSDSLVALLTAAAKMALDKAESIAEERASLRKQVQVLTELAIIRQEEISRLKERFARLGSVTEDCKDPKGKCWEVYEQQQKDWDEDEDRETPDPYEGARPGMI